MEKRRRPPRTSILDLIIARGTEPTVLELQCMLSMIEQRRVTGLAPDTVKRCYADLITRLAANRCGITLGNAMQIAAGRATPRAHTTQAPKGPKAEKFFERPRSRRGRGEAA